MSVLNINVPRKFKKLLSFKSASQKQARLVVDEASVRKREWNMDLAHHSNFERGLDLFAGVGFSSFIFSKSGYVCKIVEASP